VKERKEENRVLCFVFFCLQCLINTFCFLSLPLPLSFCLEFSF